LIGAEASSRFQTMPVPDLGGVALCHGDFHAVQCVERDGRLSAVVDWESAWAGNADIDLAVAHAYLDCYCPADLARAFFAGYAAVRLVPAGYEAASLPVRMAQALALMHVWHGRGREVNVRRAAGLFRAYSQR
jgi:Ser/Thr protein kinase RdoA (MazF antagonist)